MSYIKILIQKIKRKILFNWLVEFHIVGFPKSGMTWVRFFLSKYLSNISGKSFTLDFDKRMSKYYEIGPRILFSHIGTLVGKQRLLFLNKDLYKHTSKTINLLKNKKVIFLCRDPRDVVVSWYHHMKIVRPATETLSDFMRDEKIGIKFIVDYMNMWAKARDSFKSFNVFTYEDRKENPEREFSRFLNVLNVSLDENIFKETLIESSFEKMKEYENNAKDEFFEKSETQRVRKGGVGGYKEVMSEEDIIYCNKIVNELDSVYERYSY